MKPFRVLTLDGGGMRGLYTAVVLKTLLQRFNINQNIDEYDLGKSFDLICGTSTGAILACALAAGISLNDIIDLYSNKGKGIFDDPVPIKKTKLYKWIFKYRSAPSANVKKLKNILTKIFGDITLKNIYDNRNICLCIPAINANNYKPWVFKTPHNPEKHRDNNYKLSDVCLSSSAAPLFFPLAKLNDPGNNLNNQYFVDGGLWANNPILVGLTEALQINKTPQRSIELISIGTCSKPLGDPAKTANHNWGIKDWISGSTIMEMSLSSQAFGHNYIAEFIADSISHMGNKITITRLEETNKSPEKFSAIGLDKADKIAIATLIQLAIEDVDNIHGKLLKIQEYNPVKDIFTKVSLKNMEVENV